jgi:membrane-associated phospholipid phosphatase
VNTHSDEPVEAAAQAEFPITPTEFVGQQVGRRALVGVWGLVAVFAVVTAVWSRHVGVGLRDPGGLLFRGRLPKAVALFAVLAAIDATIRTHRRGWTMVNALATMRDRWSPRRLAYVGSGLIAYHVVYLCYRNLKSWDAFNRPRDRQLLAADRWLFAGHSPAVLLHHWLGQGEAVYLLMVAYKAFTSLVPLSLTAAMAFVPRIKDAYVFLASAMWVWVLGVGSYYLVPSLGPFASAPQEFAGLPHTAITRTQAEYLAARAHLLASPQSPHAFASVSAFASLHVAFTTLVVLMALHYRRRRLACVLASYLAVVMVATVYFGWHFVIDDLAGVLLGALAVLLGRLTILPGSRTA